MSDVTFDILRSMICFWVITSSTIVIAIHYFKDNPFCTPLSKVFACFGPTMVFGAFVTGVSFSPLLTMLVVFVGLIAFLICGGF